MIPHLKMPLFSLVALATLLPDQFMRKYIGNRCPGQNIVTTLHAEALRSMNARSARTRSWFGRLASRSPPFCSMERQLAVIRGTDLGTRGREFCDRQGRGQLAWGDAE